MFVRNSPRFHQIASDKRSKIKFPRGSMPPDPPTLPHVLYADTYLPPNNPYSIILPPLGEKSERNLVVGGLI